MKIGYPFYWLISKSSIEGAQTTIYCCVDDSIPSLSGKYFSDCKVKEPSKEAQDENEASKLWNLSVKLVGL
jgi:retinol dehydrogenase 12